MEVPQLSVNTVLGYVVHALRRMEKAWKACDGGIGKVMFAPVSLSSSFITSQWT